MQFFFGEKLTIHSDISYHGYMSKRQQEKHREKASHMWEKIARASIQKNKYFDDKKKR